MQTKHPDDYNSTESNRPDFLRESSGNNSDEEENMEDRANSGEAENTGSKSNLSPDELNGAEQSGGDKRKTPAEEKESDSIPYNQEQSRRHRFNKAKNKLKAKKNKLKVGLTVGTAGSILAIIVLILISMSSLKLAALAEHITVWNMARSARSWRQNISRVTEEQIATEVMDESRYNQLKSRFGETKVGAAIEKVNSYRPAKVLGKMNANTQPIFRDVGERKFLKFLGPQKEFIGWDIDGATIEKTNTKWYKPVDGYRQKLRLSAEAQAAFEKKFPNANTLVRNRAVKQWLAERNVKLYGFVQRGEKFKGLSREAGAAHEAEISSKERRTPPGPCKVDATCKTSKAAKDATDTKVAEAAKNPEGTGGGAKIGLSAADEGAAAIKGGTSGVQSILSKTSIVYTVVVPVCLIYEGSLNNAASTIDNSETTSVKAFFDLNSTYHQQKDGEITSEALQAKADKYGNISNSIPEKRARLAPVDTIADTNPAMLPQSSSLGSYSLLDAQLGEYLDDSIINRLNSVLDTACPTITSLEAGIAFTALEIALAIFSGGTSEGAKQSAKVGIQTLLAKAATRLTTKTVGEQVVASGARYIAGNLIKVGGNFALKTGLFVGGTFGLTELARANVLKHSNLENSGLATDEVAAAHSDIGGNVYNSVVMKEVNFAAPLTTEQAVIDLASNTSYINNLNQSKGFSERYFALSNHYSFLSKVSSTILASIENNMLLVDFFGFLSNPFSQLGKVFANVTPSKVSAAENIKGAGEYNLVQWGYTQAENNLIDNDEEYAPIVNELILDTSGRTQEISDKYGKCFSESNGTLLSKGWIVRNDEGSVDPDKGDCSPNKLGLNNSEGFGDLVFRWRLKNRYDSTLGFLKDIQNIGGATP